MSEIYKRVKRYSNKKHTKSISVALAIEISLDFIIEKSEGIMNNLYHLALCPSGLSDEYLKIICDEWNQEWIDILMEKSIIIERKIFDEDYTFDNTLNRRNTPKNKSKSKRMRRYGYGDRYRAPSFDGEISVCIYQVEPTLIDQILQRTTQKKINSRDLKIVEFMNNTMQELEKASRSMG